MVADYGDISKIAINRVLFRYKVKKKQNKQTKKHVEV